MTEPVLRVCGECGTRLPIGTKCEYCARYDAIVNQYVALEGGDRFEPDEDDATLDE